MRLLTSTLTTVAILAGTASMAHAAPTGKSPTPAADQSAETIQACGTHVLTVRPFGKC